MFFNLSCFSGERLELALYIESLSKHKDAHLRRSVPLGWKRSVAEVVNDAVWSCQPCYGIGIVVLSRLMFLHTQRLKPRLT